MPVNLQTPSLSLRERVSRWLLPLRCLVCGEAAPQRDMCTACIAALPINIPACAICALPLPIAAPACGECLQKPPPFSSLITAWRYEGAIAQLLPRFKFHHDLAAGRVLGELAMQQLADWDGWRGVQLIVPMPLHTTRLGQRGYNQALELARPFACSYRLPLDTKTLIRQRATAAQTDLDASARRRNLRGAFAATPLSGEVVLLLDDVVTTAATLHEAARTLRRAGASDVRALAMARAP